VPVSLWYARAGSPSCRFPSCRVCRLTSVPADDPSHLDFPVVGKPFHAGLTSGTNRSDLYLSDLYRDAPIWDDYLTTGRR
jgi:hypothetical protein